MILKTLFVDAQELERRTGWVIKPEGACKGVVCVPLPPMASTPQVDARVLAERLSMPLLHDTVHDVWCLGPEAGGRVLSSALLPDIVLPDVEGTPCALRELRAQKVLLVAWASW